MDNGIMGKWLWLRASVLAQSYDTKITQKTDLMTLVSCETLFAGTPHLLYYSKLMIAKERYYHKAILRTPARQSS